MNDDDIELFQLRVAVWALLGMWAVLVLGICVLLAAALLWLLGPPARLLWRLSGLEPPAWLEETEALAWDLLLIVDRLAWGPVAVVERWVLAVVEVVWERVSRGALAAEAWLMRR